MFKVFFYKTEKRDLHDLAFMAYHLFSNNKMEPKIYTQNKKDNFFFSNLSQKMAKHNK